MNFGLEKLALPLYGILVKVKFSDGVTLWPGKLLIMILMIVRWRAVQLGMQGPSD